MSEIEPKTTGSESPAPVSTLPQLNPVDVFFALGSEVRWPIVKLLADGSEKNISDIRAVVGSTAENISKQLRMMVVAGVLENRPGADRRQSVFFIPAARRATPGVLDFGFCLLKLDKA